MILSITVYKNTGKFYLSHEVELPDVELGDQRFITLIQNNLPGEYKDGYVVVADASPDNVSWHNALFTWEYLFPDEYCQMAVAEMWEKAATGVITSQEYLTWFNGHCSNCRLRCTEYDRLPSES